MDQYRWNILGISNDIGHKLNFSSEEDKHQQGLGLFVHKDTTDTVMGCWPVSSRLITIRKRAIPIKITIIHVYVPTLMYEDSEVQDFYDQLQAILDKIPKKDNIVQGDWSAKVGEDAYTNQKDGVNSETNHRGLKLGSHQTCQMCCLPLVESVEGVSQLEDHRASRASGRYDDILVRPI